MRISRRWIWLMGVGSLLHANESSWISHLWTSTYALGLAAVSSTVTYFYAQRHGYQQAYHTTMREVTQAQQRPYPSCLQTIPANASYTALQQEHAEDMYHCLTLHNQSLESVIDTSYERLSRLGGALANAQELYKREPSEQLGTYISEAEHTYADMHARIQNLTHNKPVLDTFIKLKGTSAFDRHKQRAAQIAENTEYTDTQRIDAVRSHLSEVYGHIAPITPCAHAHHDIKRDIEHLDACEHHLRTTQVPSTMQHLHNDITTTRKRLQRIVSLLEQDKRCLAEIHYEKHALSSQEKLDEIQRSVQTQRNHIDTLRGYVTNVHDTLSCDIYNTLWAINTKLDYTQTSINQHRDTMESSQTQETKEREETSDRDGHTS